VTHRHSLQTLAADHGYVVSFCPECEIVHVDVGPVTLRLRPAALDSLARVLDQASAVMHEAAGGRPIRLVPPPVVN